METTGEIEMLTRLADRLNRKGTGRDRSSVARRLPKRTTRNWRRDWRLVCQRWLRRYTPDSGRWHLGGHHIGRAAFGPAIIEAYRPEQPGAVVVEGRPVLLEVRT
jgi:hypothetical protein